MKRLALSAAAISISLMTAASAADLTNEPAPVVEQAVAMGPNWTGFYLGGAVGALLDDARQHGTGFPDATVPDKNSTSVALGVYGGYNYQFGSNVVLGIEGDASWLNTDFNGNHSGNDWEYLKQDWSFTLAGRAGYLVTPSTLLYAKAGWSITDTKLNDWNNSPYPVDIDDGWINSVQVGGGVEALIQKNWLLRLEGLYNFGLQNVSAGYAICSGGCNYELKPNFAQVRLGLGYKF